MQPRGVRGVGRSEATRRFAHFCLGVSGSDGSGDAGKEVTCLQRTREPCQRINSVPASLFPKDHGGLVINNDIQMHPSEVMFPEALDTSVDHCPGEALTALKTVQPRRAGGIRGGHRG